jgi:hypothetical protein
MKANYIQPEITITYHYFEGHLCAGTGIRQADFGAHGENDYSNSLWDNQGWGDTETPVIAGNDNGELNSTSKSFNLWDE